MRMRLTMFLILSLVLPCLLYAAEIPEDLAVKAIVGEAEDQGYRGMLAVACGIRNRGTLKGVVGVRSKRALTPGLVQKKYWDMARKAWKESETNRMHNADHWENIKQFGIPEWAGRMVLVITVGDHAFYRNR